MHAVIIRLPVFLLLLACITLHAAPSKPNFVIILADDLGYQEIGRVLEQLRAMNAFEDTLILFLSDNGASAEIMVRGLGHDKATPMGSAASYLCLGGGISTPFIAHWPKGIVAKGELRHTPGHVIDVVPTLLALAGPKPEAKKKGKGKKK